MIRIIEIVILACMAGFFDYMMDAIKDYQESNKFWLWNKVKETKYEFWYLGWHSLPFFEKRGWIYNPGLVWLSDAWHMAKHGMLLSWSGAVACSFGTYWYYQIVVWWLAYYIEGEIFNVGYQRLKQ